MNVAQGRRILITGVSRFWGAELARRLEADPSVEQIVAVDTEGPIRQLARTDFVRADIRHSLVGKLIRGLGIDTVVHSGLIVDPQQAGGPDGARDQRHRHHEPASPRAAARTARCAGWWSSRAPPCTAASPTTPPSGRRTCAGAAPARDGFTRDLDEVESYVREYEVRHPDVAVTLLRFGNVLGDVLDSPFARLFDRAVIPTVFGFDPRLQFLDEDDAVSALAHATLNECRGTYNVAGAGVVVLSQAIALLGKINAPVIPFVGGTLAMRVARALRARRLPRRVRTPAPVRPRRRHHPPARRARLPPAEHHHPDRRRPRPSAPRSRCPRRRGAVPLRGRARGVPAQPRPARRAGGRRRQRPQHTAQAHHRGGRGEQQPSARAASAARRSRQPPHGDAATAPRTSTPTGRRSGVDHGATTARPRRAPQRPHRRACHPAAAPRRRRRPAAAPDADAAT